jgi:predicted dehydrogenase
MRFLVGEYMEVQAVCETMIKERPLKQVDKLRNLQVEEKMGKVEVDDIALMQVKMKNGAIGTLEASRLATGANNDLKFEINGSKGAIAFNLMEPNWLYVYDVRDKSEPFGGMRGYKRVETVQRYPDASFPGPKFEIGWMRYNIAALAAFVKNIIEDKPCSPDLYDGMKVQEVMENAYKSAQEGRRIIL